jgi:hypothetical protein
MKHAVKPHTLREFVDLIDRCKAQAEHDPTGYTENPHLYDAVHHVYLRLCHGNILSQLVR